MQRYTSPEKKNYFCSASVAFQVVMQLSQTSLTTVQTQGRRHWGRLGGKCPPTQSKCQLNDDQLMGVYYAKLVNKHGLLILLICVFRSGYYWLRLLSNFLGKKYLQEQFYCTVFSFFSLHIDFSFSELDFESPESVNI